MVFGGLGEALGRWLSFRGIMAGRRLRRLVRRFRGFFYVFVVIALWAASTSSNVWIVDLRRGTWELTEPVFRGLHSVMEVLFYQVPQFFRDWHQAYQRLHSLRLQEDNIRFLERETDQICKENDDLRRLLKAPEREKSSLITAHVVGIPTGLLMRSVLISVAPDRAVAHDAAVMTPQGLVGRVIETSGRLARVLLITDPTSRVPVVLQPSGVHAIAAGTNEDSLTLLHQQEGGPIHVGDRVFSSGYGGVFPAGQPVGVVVSVAEGRILLKPSADVWSLRFVRVSVPSSETLPPPSPAPEGPSS